MLLGESTSLNKERDGQCGEALGAGSKARAKDLTDSRNQYSARQRICRKYLNLR